MTDTMTVMVDGVEQQRPIELVDAGLGRMHRAGQRVHRPVPVLREGEWMTETLDGIVHIHTLKPR